MMDFQILALVVVVVVVTFIYRAVKVVPQQSAWVVERLGKFRAVLPPDRKSTRLNSSHSS